MGKTISRKETLRKAVHAIRGKIGLLQSCARKGDLARCRTALTELLAYNELLHGTGMYSAEKKRWMNRIIKHYAPDPKRVLANRLKGGASA